MAEIETPLAPSIVVFIVSYFLSCIFLGIVDITCKSIIQYYFMDQEMFVGEQRFAEDFIKEFMEFYNNGEEDKRDIQRDNYVKAEVARIELNVPIEEDEDEIANRRAEEEAKRKKAMMEDSDDDDDDEENGDDGVEEGQVVDLDKFRKPDMDEAPPSSQGDDGNYRL
jgi:hypothetical protein